VLIASGREWRSPTLSAAERAPGGGFPHPSRPRHAGRRHPPGQCPLRFVLLGLEVLTVSFYGLIAYPRRRRRPSKPPSSTWCSPARRRPSCCSAWRSSTRCRAPLVLKGLSAAGNGPFRLGGSDLPDGAGAHVHRGGLQARPGPLPSLDTGRVPGRSGAGDGLSSHASKAAVFVVLLQFLAPLDPRSGGVLVVVFSIVAYASMLAGNTVGCSSRTSSGCLGYSSHRPTRLPHRGAHRLGYGREGGCWRSIFRYIRSHCSRPSALSQSCPTRTANLNPSRSTGGRATEAAAGPAVLITVLMPLPGPALRHCLFTAVLHREILHLQERERRFPLWGLLIAFALTSAMSLILLPPGDHHDVPLDMEPYAAALARSPEGRAEPPLGPPWERV